MPYPLHNAHVVLYKQLLCRLAEQQRRPMAQLHYYTEAILEVDPTWTVYKT